MSWAITPQKSTDLWECVLSVVKVIFSTYDSSYISALFEGKASLRSFLKRGSCYWKYPKKKLLSKRTRYWKFWRNLIIFCLNFIIKCNNFYFLLTLCLLEYNMFKKCNKHAIKIRFSISSAKSFSKCPLPLFGDGIFDRMPPWRFGRGETFGITLQGVVKTYGVAKIGQPLISLQQNRRKVVLTFLMVW